ncbi:MAG: hypothetical protein GXP30_12315 [Verrucomicrobia bacterium]|nr:hypothetical protein [Verrucomicrobiota bacterium]
MLLVQSPEKHDGKRVRVIGYRVNDTLYPDAKAYEKIRPPGKNIRIINGDRESGIILSGPSSIADPKKLGASNGQQVVIEGTFEFRPHPPFENFTHKGTLRRLTLIKAFK